MKKQYINPEMAVVEMVAARCLCGSVSPNNIETFDIEIDDSTLIL